MLRCGSRKWVPQASGCLRACASSLRLAHGAHRAAKGTTAERGGVWFGSLKHTGVICWEEGVVFGVILRGNLKMPGSLKLSHFEGFVGGEG